MFSEWWVRMARMTMGLSPYDYLMPEDDIDERTFVCKDQSLMSIIKVKGLFNIPGEPEVKRAEAAVHNLIKTYVVGGGHSLSSHFASDPAGTRDYLEHCMVPARNAARAMDVDITDIIEENIDQAAESCVYEENYLVLWTHPAAVNKEEQVEGRKRLAKRMKEAPVATMEGRNLFLAIDTVVNQHEGFVDQALAELADSHLDAEVVGRHEVVGTMRRWADTTATHDWRPVLHGDTVPPREALPGAPPQDISTLLWPRIDWQVGRTPIEPVDEAPQFARIGQRFYGAVLVSLYPQDLHRFHSLFSRIPRKVPWRMATHINGGADQFLEARRLLTRFTHWMSGDNAGIRRDLDRVESDLNGTDEDPQTYDRARVQTHFVTWADSLEGLRRQMSALTQAIEGWGAPTLELDNIDPGASVMASVPGAMYHSTAAPSYARIQDIVRMLPVSRPTSPWEQGAMIFSTTDQKAFAYQPGSHLQAAHIDLFFAKSGNGKSVLSNAINTAMILKGGTDQLPDIAILDIGRSAAGQVRMIKKRLPKSRRHEAVVHRMTMSEESSYNVMDTDLGARSPLPPHRAAIRDVIDQLLTAPGEHLHQELHRMIPLVIDRTFATFSDRSEHGRPKRYTPGLLTDIDPLAQKAARDQGWTLDADTTWWEVVDGLFRAGYPNEAIVAQRHAVPTLMDMVSVVTTDQVISSQYGKKSGMRLREASEETVAEAFARILGAALDELPVLKGVTQIDYSRGRIKVMDLNDVAPKGGEAEERQTGIMYTVALQAMTGHYSVDLEYLDHYDDLYRDYHEARIRRIRSEAKRVVCDELHRAPPRIVRVLERLVKEGRKNKFSVGLISQRLADFSEALVVESTSRFILGQPEPQEIEGIKAAFHMSETGIHALTSNMVHPPRAGIGSAFLAMFATENGLCTQVVRMKKGPRELWSYSTTREDTDVAEAVEALVGEEEAEAALAYAYPGGSIKSEVARRAKTVGAKSDEFMTESQKKSLIAQLADEIVARYTSRPDRAA